MPPRRFGTAFVIAASALVVGGCATVSNPNPADPLEGWNRGMQRFNDTIDDALLRPVAEAYRDVVPSFVRTGVGNFFGNLGDAWSAANHLLQGKLEPALAMTMRLGLNSTLGLAGVLDIATEAGLDRQSEDFGQTLGRWGVGAGPYLVLPLLGASTVRDTAALPLDRYATSPSLLGWDDGELWAATGLQLVHTRSTLLGASRLLGEIALDRYTFIRDAYLSRRRNLVWDGDPPELPADRDADPAASAPAAPASAAK
jgi:phospholipid-binding lipoprotein MlaA